jgi:gamma-glutamylcyclotransferase (GGCT)/AIG2-like uncharacterized protein YtfP
MILDLTRNVFAYGSLMSTADVEVGRHERRQLTAAATLLGPASIGGLLFDVGPYPAAVLTTTGRERIYGELWRLPRRCGWLFDVLDRYEGCALDAPKPHAYERRKVSVLREDGGTASAWIYLWNRPLGVMPRIEGGRWQASSRIATPIADSVITNAPARRLNGSLLAGAYT